MVKIGLIDSIYEAASNVDSGRKGFAINGKEREGRILYELGINQAMSSFQEAQVSADPQIIILAEYTFISQEFALCDKADKDTIDSLTKAIESFDDAFLALQAVDEPCYTAVEKAIPHNGKYRVNGYPKDAYHIACIGHHASTMAPRQAV